MSLTDETLVKMLQVSRAFPIPIEELEKVIAQASEANKLRKVVDAAREVKEHGWRHAFGETGALLNTPRLRLEQALADLDKEEV